MKSWKIFMGLGLILVAVVLILDAVGVLTPLVSVVGEITIFEIVAGLFLVALIIERLIHRKISSIFFLLAFLFMLFEENIAHLCKLEDENIINNWLVLLIAMLLSIGFSILFSSKKKSHGFSLEINGHRAESSFSASTVYVDCKDFTPSSIENNLGACSVYFDNAESYSGGMTLNVENNLGSMIVNVPSDWIIRSDIENNLGSTSIPKNEDKSGPILNIHGENNLGSLTVKYV